MSGHISIGDKRLEYLDLASKALIYGDVDNGQTTLDVFLSTIPPNSPMDKEIKRAFERIETEKGEYCMELMESTERLNEWAKTERRVRRINAMSVKMPSLT